VPAAVHQLPDGEQLAVLEREGDYGWCAASVPAVCADCGHWRIDCVVSPVHADHYRDGVPGVGCSGAAGVFLEQRATALEPCEPAVADLRLHRRRRNGCESAEELHEDHGE